MKFSDLEPNFLKIISEDKKTWQWQGVALADADGVIFLCPKCWQENNGPIGTHSIVCWQPHVPLTAELTGPWRWPLLGTSVADLSLGVPGENLTSVLLENGCGAHFWVRHGEIVWA